MTDTEKLRDTRSECGARGRNPRVKRGSRDAVSACGERSVDRLYLRAAANARTKGSRHTLLVIRSDYEGQGGNALSVSKGDVVALLSDHVSDWFWVRSRDGREGFIPAVIAGHGFLWLLHCCCLSKISCSFNTIGKKNYHCIIYHRIICHLIFFYVRFLH